LQLFAITTVAVALLGGLLEARRTLRPGGIQHYQRVTRNVSLTCRFFGISRSKFLLLDEAVPLLVFNKPLDHHNHHLLATAKEAHSMGLRVPKPSPEAALRHAPALES